MSDMPNPEKPAAAHAAQPEAQVRTAAPKAPLMTEQADDAMPDTAPSSAHSFSKESMIIEPPTFKEMPDFHDVHSTQFWNLLWFNFGRPVMVGALWVAGAILVVHVAVHWSDMPRPVLAVAAAVTALLLAAALRHRFLPKKSRKNTAPTKGSEISAFFATDKEHHSELRHSKRVDVYFDGSRVGLVSEKQSQITFGKLPFSTKKPDGRPLRALNVEGVAQAKEAGMPLP